MLLLGGFRLARKDGRCGSRPTGTAVRRRAKEAEIKQIAATTVLATGITAYLKNGGGWKSRSDRRARIIQDDRTLYDRRSD